MLHIIWALMKRGDHNLLYLDWENLVDSGYSVFEKSHQIAFFVSKCIDKLVNKNLNLDSFHLVGYSIGGQLVGVIASKLRTGKPGRITALNPLRVSFWESPFLYHAYKLHMKYAKFVDVVHTSSYTGIGRRMGHVDFYVNGGKKIQPGCEDTKNKVYSILCSHEFSILIFAISVYGDPNNLLARECGSVEEFYHGYCDDNKYIPFGFPVNTTERGKYYIYTNPVSPIAEGMNPPHPNRGHIGKGKEGISSKNIGYPLDNDDY